MIAGGLIFYIDGVSVCNYPYGNGGITLGDNGTNICLGGACDWLRAAGAMDEFRLAVGATRSADWIKTEVNNQSDPGTFYSISPP